MRLLRVLLFFDPLFVPHRIHEYSPVWRFLPNMILEPNTGFDLRANRVFRVAGLL